MAAKREIRGQRDFNFAIDKQLHIRINRVARALRACKQIANHERESKIVLRVQRFHFLKDGLELTVHIANDCTIL